MDVPLFLLPHRVSSEPFLGEGSEGPSYGPAVAHIPVRQEGDLTVDANGQHVGSVKLYAQLAAEPSLVLGSRVALGGGGEGYVQAVATFSDGGLGGWEHVEVVVAAS